MKKNQCEKILRYMQENGSITPVDAMAEFGCMRLAARVADLKKDGYPIVKRMRSGRNRYDEKVSFAEYFLEVEPYEAKTNEGAAVPPSS